MFNALWILLLLVVVGCAQGTSPSLDIQNPDYASHSTVPTSGSIGTEGGGNHDTLVKVFWYEWERLAVCMEKLSANEKDLPRRLDLQIFASNLREIFDREEQVLIGDFTDFIGMEEERKSEVSRGRIKVSLDYFQLDLFGKHILLINFANRYGKTRLEWHSNNVGRAAYLCAPGTEL